VTSRAIALPLETGPVSTAVDGSLHGRGCYGEDGTLRCGWPEQHDGAFVQLLDFVPGRTVVVGGSRDSLLDRFVTALTVVAAVAIVALVVTVRMCDLHFQTVLSGSMRPTFSPGDVAVTQAVPVGTLRVGDAISFYPPGQTTPVLHRIASIETTRDGVVITTRGDANTVNDQWRVTLQGTTAYRLVAVVPLLGWLTELQRPAFLFAGLLLGLWVLLELRKEVRARAVKVRLGSQS